MPTALGGEAGELIGLGALRINSQAESGKNLLKQVLAWGIPLNPLERVWVLETPN